MVINMKVSPVSFNSKTPKFNNRQDFDELRDKALDSQLKELLPMFMSGDADVVFISTTVTPQQELKMDVKTAKMDELKETNKVSKKQETLWDKIKKVFKK